MMTGTNKHIAVLTVSYNHEKWIGQCIESVFHQKCSMPIVQYIWDDNSSDSTWSIIQKYKNNYSDQIIAYRQLSNRGAANNYFDVLEAILQDPKNEYIALLDGDDFWLNVNHLEEKTSFLNGHDDFGIVHSNICILHHSGRLTETKRTSECVPQGDIFDIMLTKPLFSALSVVMRAALLRDLPIEELRLLPLQAVDHVIESWVCSKSKVKFSEFVAGVWRRHEHTISTSNNLQTSLRWIEHECAQHNWIVSHFPECSISHVNLRYHKDNMLFGAYFVAGKYSDAVAILNRNNRAGEYNLKYARIIKKGRFVYYTFFIIKKIKSYITKIMSNDSLS